MKRALCLFTAVLLVGASAGPVRATYTVTIHPGFNLIAHAVNHPVNNDLNHFFVPLPSSADGTKIFRFDCAAQVFDSNVPEFFAGAGWDPGGVIINPGEGFILHNPVNTTFTFQFVGTGLNQFSPVPADGKVCFVSRKNDNFPTAYEDIFGGPPQAGKCTIIGRWNPDPKNRMHYYSFNNGAWSPQAPVLDAGEAVYVRVVEQDLTPQMVVSAAPDCTLTKIVLHFKKAVNPLTAEVPGNYILGGGLITGAKADLESIGDIFRSWLFGSKRVTLTVAGALTPGKTYTLFVKGVSDFCGNTVPNNSFITFKVSQAPRIVAVEPDCANNQLILTYDRPMSGSALAPGSYVITPFGPVVAAAQFVTFPPFEDDTRVRLTVGGTGLSPGTLYTIAANVSSACPGNPSGSSSISFVCNKTITGRKFSDANGDGSLGAGDYALPN